MSNESEQYRAGFEAWVLNRVPSYKLARDDSGKYASYATQCAWIVWAEAKREASTEPSAVPVAYAVVSVKGGVHKLAITRESAERKAAKWKEEWPNNGCRVRALAFADEIGAGALPDEAKDAARLEVGERIISALEAMIPAIRGEETAQFLRDLVAECRGTEGAK